MYLSEFLNDAFENEWTMESVRIEDGKVLTTLESEDGCLRILFDQLSFNEETLIEIHKVNSEIHDVYTKINMIKIGEVKADYLQFLKNLLEVVPER